jgi:hypothetical protein
VEKHVSDGYALSADERLSPRDVFLEDININLVVEMKSLLPYTKPIKDINAARICIRFAPKVRFSWLFLM